MLQLSMLADCADVCSSLTRSLDTEASDAATLSEAIESVLHQLDTLFCQQKCIELGYTCHMLSILERGRACVVAGESFNLGGPDSVTVEMVKRCLGRMANFIVLFLKTLDAEFPAWNVIQNFHCFDLPDHGKTPSYVRPLRRLCQVFGGNVPDSVAREHLCTGDASCKS